MRLIPAVEDGPGVQSKCWHRWLRLEFLYIHIILHMHLQYGIASALGLHLDGTPSVGYLERERYK